MSACFNEGGLLMKLKNLDPKNSSQEKSANNEGINHI